MSDTRLLDGATFLRMVKAGAARLNENRTTVNDLNVFPIPDGDTGDNMYMTIASGCQSGESADSENLSDMATAIAKGMLLGARGNSGVILSRFIAGIAKGLTDLDKADLQDCAKALICGIDEAYHAVLVPVEGTMLTVYKDAVNYANSRISDQSTFETFYADFNDELMASLKRTPDLLSVLKDAGVVDSGGAGLVYISQGISEVIGGKDVVSSASAPAPAPQAPKADISLFTEDSVLEFGYCTEFLLRLQNSKLDVASFDEKPLIEWLQSNGDSVVAFRDGSIVKVHIHTKTPGEILNHCQKYGEFLTLKIENMTLQHQETTIANNFSLENGPAKAASDDFITRPRKRYGVVTVASGAGLVSTLKDAGADIVIEGGQTMNPSAQDFVNAFSQVEASTIFVFPNNSNIIMTAEQASGICADRDIRVIPSKSFGAGYVGIASMDMSEKDADALFEAVKASVEEVATGMISRAIRGTMRDGVAVKEGDFIAFSGGKILADSPRRAEAASALCGAMGAADHDVALIFSGKEVPSQEAEELASALQTEFPRTEFIFTDGGQPVYDYILVLC